MADPSPKISQNARRMARILAGSGRTHTGYNVLASQYQRAAAWKAAAGASVATVKCRNAESTAWAAAWQLATRRKAPYGAGGSSAVRGARLVAACGMKCQKAYGGKFHVAASFRGKRILAFHFALTAMVRGKSIRSIYRRRSRHPALRKCQRYRAGCGVARSAQRRRWSQRSAKPRTGTGILLLPRWYAGEAAVCTFDARSTILDYQYG